MHGAGECGTGAHGAGAYGAGGAPFDARGAWSPRSYFAIAFLASFFPAAVLYELNWIRLGRRRNAALRILGWSVAAGLMVASAVCLPDQARYLFWAINMGAAAFFVHRQAPAFDAYRRQGRPEAKLRHAGWPLAASLVGMLVLVCAAGFGYAAHVDRHFEAGLAAMDRAEATGQDRADYRDAQRHFETYIELVPDDPGAHHNLAVIFAELGDFERARDQIRRVRKLEPDYVALEELDEHVFVAEHNHAVDLIDGGDYEEAEALLRACHQARPDHVLSVDNLMVALLAQDRFDEARETGETFLATHPEAEPIRDRLERMDVDAAAIPNDRAGTTSL